jgi:hypothetical protein
VLVTGIDPRCLGGCAGCDTGDLVLQSAAVAIAVQ